MAQHVDRIGSLPEPLLHHILSFLPTKNVVQTSILSKRWTYLWSSIPFLDFQLDSMKHNSAEFFKFVDYVLFRRMASTIQKVRLHMNFGRADMTRVMSWIIFFLQHNVEVLDVYLDIQMPLEFRVSHLFTSASLKMLQLKLSWAVLNLPNTMSLPSLQTLELDRVKFEDHGPLCQLVSSCPSLHTLIIYDCIFANEHLTVSNRQLESLSILFNDFDSPFFTISAPRLISLNMGLIRLLSIDNFPSLVNARINLWESSLGSIEQLIRALKTAESLELSGDFLAVCAREFDAKSLNWECIQSPFINLKFLKLVSSLSNCEVQVIKTILRFSPNIETFVVENVNIPVGKPEATKMGKFVYDLSCLRLVKYQNFVGLENEYKFVEFFLEEALNLKKMIIQCADRKVDTEVHDQIRELLSKCPRVGDVCLDADDYRFECRALFKVDRIC